ncbi:TonB-dependent receptor [Echinicola sp. 20G]|uniref:SusC/RagA family TonB-linked outer membrane protein n=1 Tax=Echinicola sp. 20G TaxID=2781961 RepID=UPI00191011FF|nr:TonB-dependent receptor [Echinicola sp. 20G]
MKKNLLILLMRVTTRMLCLAAIIGLSMTVSLAGNLSAQNLKDTFVKVDSRQYTLQSLIRLIEEQTDFNFSYKGDFDLSYQISLNQKSNDLRSILGEVKKQSPYSYKQINNSIGLSLKQQGATPSIIQDERKIRGVVMDKSGVTIPGANIIEVGTTNGTATDIDGNFEITLTTTSPVIKVSFVGYQSLEVNIGASSVYEIVLEEDQEALDEVVVVGFGEQKKVSVVGSVTTIKPKELKIPTSNLSQSFAGRLSGVVAVQRSGEPGRDAAQFWIRGLATFGNTNPLVFMDGIEISIGDMNSIDPMNIENFSILKDASATAIYGARGANGVILIETKRGEILDKPQVNIMMENSFMSPTKLPEFADAVTFMEMYNTARRNQNPFQPAKYTEEKIQGTRDGLDPYVFPNVDWMDELFKDYSTRQYANVNVRGGGTMAKYYMAVSYYKDQGILRKTDVNDFNNNIDQNRYNFVNNITVNVSPTTELELNLNADIIDYNGPAVDASGIFGNVMNSNPVRFPVTYPAQEETGYIWFGNKTGGFVNNAFYNPYADLVKGYKERNNSTLLSTVRIRQNLDVVTKGLSFAGLASFKNWTSSQITRSYEPYFYEMTGYEFDEATGQYTYDLGLIGQGGREALAQSGSNNGDRSLFFQASLNYNRSFEKHDVGGLLVYLQRQYNTNIVGGDLTASLPSRNQGISGRVTYAYDERYLLEANFGYNGSENFIEGKRFGFFPSVAFGYVLSNEAFFAGLTNTFSLLKIRGSFGISGNDRIGDERFPYLSNVNLSAGDGAGYTFGENFNNSRNGVVINRYANPDITWEEGKKLNLGMDLELFSKLMLNVDVFKEIRSGIFMQRNTVPGTIGVGDAKPYANLGKVENKGIDLTLAYNQSFSQDLMVSTRGTFTFARNKILEIDEPNRLYPYLSRVGQPINQLWGLQAERLFIDQAEIDASSTQTFSGQYYPGDIKYTDVSKEYDGFDQIDANDRVPMGHPSVPEITYGFGVNVIYKKFDFGVLFQGVANTSFFINNIQPFAQNERNVLKAIADDYWTEENQNFNAFYPRLSEFDNPNNTQNSSWWLRDGAFVRLKNAEIGYQYNPKVRFYSNGVNLMTFSKFKLWDPEQGGGNGLGYPPQRVINIGVQINL